MNSGREIISLVAERQDLDQFRRKNWEGTFEEYLDLTRREPRVTRNATAASRGRDSGWGAKSCWRKSWYFWIGPLVRVDGNNV